MPQPSVDASWTGDLKSGSGGMNLGSGAYTGAFSFVPRFEDGDGTNPEELITAAHAGCYSMVLSNALDENDFDPQRVSTTANVNLDSEGDDPEIDRFELDAKAEVPGIDEDEFLEIANDTKEGCPVFKVLAGATINLDIELV